MQLNLVMGAVSNGDRTPKACDAADTDAARDNQVMKQDALFERFSARLKAQVGPEVYASWFARLKLHSVSKSVVRFTVPTTFLKSWINNRYIDLITTLVQSEDADVLKVEILVRSASRPARPAPVEERAQPAADVSASVQRAKPFIPPQPSASVQISGASAPVTRHAGSGPLIGSPLDSRFTFDTFVEGASNRVALAAAKTIAEAGAGAVRFNPLFIHAGVGLGKTHLLQAIANAAIDSPRNPRVVYLTAEYFMWRFATAIRDNDALTLKDTLRNIDLLVIDDMQFLQGKMIQHEFCHLLNMLLDSAKQVVVAADRAPW